MKCADAFEIWFNDGSIHLDEFGTGLDSITAVASYISNPENNSESMKNLRWYVQHWMEGKVLHNRTSWELFGNNLMCWEQLPANWEFIMFIEGQDSGRIGYYIFEEVAKLLDPNWKGIR